MAISSMVRYVLLRVVASCVLTLIASMPWVLRMRAKRDTPSTAPAASVPVTRVTLTALLLDVDCSANFGTRRLVAARIGSLKSSVI